MTTQREQNLAEWEAVRAGRFPHITDPALIHELHIAYMAGYSRGMAWMRDLYDKTLNASLSA